MRKLAIFFVYFLLLCAVCFNVWVLKVSSNEKRVLREVLITEDAHERLKLLESIKPVLFNYTPYHLLSLVVHVELRMVPKILKDLDLLIAWGFDLNFNIRSIVELKTELIKMKNQATSSGIIQFSQLNYLNAHPEIKELITSISKILLKDKVRSPIVYFVILLFLTMYYFLFKLLEGFIENIFELSLMMSACISFFGWLGYLIFWCYLNIKSGHMIESVILLGLGTFLNWFWVDSIASKLASIADSKTYWHCKKCKNENSSDHLQCWQCNMPK